MKTPSGLLIALLAASVAFPAASRSQASSDDTAAKEAAMNQLAGQMETEIDKHQPPAAGTAWGVGVQIFPADDGSVQILNIMPGSPAARDKRLKPSDRIVAVDPGDGKFVDTAGMTIDAVTKLILGEKGTKVRLRVVPADNPGKTTEISLVRGLELDVTLNFQMYERKDVIGGIALHLEGMGADKELPGLIGIIAKKYPKASAACGTTSELLGCMYRTLAAFEYADALRLGLADEDGAKARESLQDLLKDPGLLIDDAASITKWSKQAAPQADVDLRRELQRQAKSHYQMANFFLRRESSLKRAARKGAIEASDSVPEAE